MGERRGALLREMDALGTCVGGVRPDEDNSLSLELGDQRLDGLLAHAEMGSQVDNADASWGRQVREKARVGLAQERCTGFGVDPADGQLVPELPTPNEQIPEGLRLRAPDPGERPGRGRDVLHAVNDT